MFQESNERLSKAVAAMRESELRDGTYTMAEQAIMGNARFPRSVPVKGVMLVAALGAAVFGGVLVLTPTKSYAAELRRIAQNGDTGMRHVREVEFEPDGSEKLVLEYYVMGDQARMLDRFGGQLAWNNGTVKSLHSDGAVEICRKDIQIMRWMNDSAKQILAINTKDPKTKLSVEKGVEYAGIRVDRFTLDGDFVNGQGQTLHSHSILLADPATERPLEMDDTVTGQPPTATKWDYAPFDAKMLELPQVDPNRVYNTDEETEAVTSALTSHGSRVTIGGQSVELLQLWIDETGHAAAIAQASFSRPDDFGIKIDGEGQDAELLGSPFSNRHWIHKPTPYKGRPVQVFFNNRDTLAPRVTSPDLVTVEVPVFDNKSLLGYARFDNVPVHHAWNVHYLIQPRNVPFWGPPVPSTLGTQTAE